MICATRAIKNAKHLQRVAPHLMPRDEPSAGFGSILPLSVLASIHTGKTPADIAGAFAGIAFPAVNAAATALFRGTLFFVRILFTVQNQNNAVISVSASDVNTAVQYASRAAVPISQYASQYGPNSIGVSSKLFSLAVTLPQNTYNDQQLQGWVNSVVSQNNLPSSTCLVILNPTLMVNTSAPVSGGFGGYHSKANIPYIFVNVGGQGLTVTDPPFAYAGSLSHEIAEMVVDPQADGSNPEVCDPCGPNCVSTFLDYFDNSTTYIATSQQFPPNFPYGFFINGIVQPAFANQCGIPPMPASACTYAPIPLRGADHFYTTSLTERDNAIDNLGYQSEGAACYVFAGATAGAVPLHRLFNPTSGDHFYTTSDQERNTAIANSGYQSEADACFVRTATGTSANTALHRLFRPTGDHFYTTSDTERDNAVSDLGYQSEGDSCFVSATNPSNVAALYRLFRPTGDHFYTMSLAERDNAIGDGYRAENVACVIFAGAGPSRVALHRLFNSKTGDHFYTTSDQERNNAIAKFGYQSEGEAGYVFPGSTAGAVPLHRLFNPTSGDHFYTTSDQERNNAIANSGYQNEGDACFVFDTDPAGLTLLYRLFHGFS
jgi:hypothetical protein